MGSDGLYVLADPTPQNGDVILWVYRRDFDEPAIRSVKELFSSSHDYRGFSLSREELAKILKLPNPKEFRAGEMYTLKQEA